DGDTGRRAPDSIDARAFAQPDFSDATSGEPEPDVEVAAIVWEFAAHLSPKQYSLLDLHLRRGLKVDELAQTLGFTTANVYMMLYRLRRALAESVCAAFLVRPGPGQCRELDALLSETHVAESSVDYRPFVLHHVKACSRCQASTAN